MFTTSEPGGTPHDLDSVISESVVGLPRIREHQRSIEPPQASKTVSPAIAELDDAYEAGGMDEADYQTRRADLKQQLAAVWNR